MGEGTAVQLLSLDNRLASPFLIFMISPHFPLLPKKTTRRLFPKQASNNNAAGLIMIDAVKARQFIVGS